MSGLGSEGWLPDLAHLPISKANQQVAPPVLDVTLALADLYDGVAFRSAACV